MHTAIFKLFLSVVNPVGRSTAQSLLADWILVKFMPNSVPEFSFICSLSVPNFKAFRLCIKKLKLFLQVCEKNNLSPFKRKKNTRKFDHPCLINDYCILIKICCVASSRWQAAIMKILRAFLKGSWSYACVKIAIC